MQILTGVFDVVAVEAHSKASNVLTPDDVLASALDPISTDRWGLTRTSSPAWR